MTVTDEVSFWCTIVSIIVTLASIGFSIWSFSSAKSAKGYKEDTLKIKDTLDLRTFLNCFKTASEHFQNQTRKYDWYRGVDVNLIIAPFNNILLSFGEYYHLLEQCEEVKTRVHYLQNAIQQYGRYTRDEKKVINNYIVELTEYLQAETQKRLNEIAISK